MQEPWDHKVIVNIHLIVFQNWIVYVMDCVLIVSIVDFISGGINL